MADKIVVMNLGLIEQIGSPLELYHKPDNQFVAGFIGSPKMNFIPGKCIAADGTTLSIDLGALGVAKLPRKATNLVGQNVTLGIRPEHLSLGKGDFTLTLTPRIVEHLGIHAVVYADLPNGEIFTALFEGDPAFEETKPIDIGFAQTAAHLFDAAGMAVY